MFAIAMCICERRLDCSPSGYSARGHGCMCRSICLFGSVCSAYPMALVLWLCAVCWPFCLLWAVLCVVLRSCVLDAACCHVKQVKKLAWALEQRARACMTCIPACCRKQFVVAAFCLPAVVVSCFKKQCRFVCLVQETYERVGLHCKVEHTAASDRMH